MSDDAELSELHKEEAEAKRAVECAQRSLQAAMARLGLVQMKIANHRDYVPKAPAEPFDNGRVVGLPRDYRTSKQGTGRTGRKEQTVPDLELDELELD